ncbi:RHS repeat-associated core domain-containing protein [Actinomadura nitritigenes]|uniref:RHS repeat-associated core domain-containing protein n=1 Tax=Actinomadura nitritigenes TaxID=134602 RepID=UPI003D942A0A
MHDLRRVKQRKLADSGGKNASPGPKQLPSGGSGVASLALKQLRGNDPATARATAKGTPVWAQPVLPSGGTYQGPNKVAVHVADRKIANALGINGVLFTATPQGGNGPVEIGVDYHKFSGAFGGNYGSRLHLVSLPACALTTPQVPACRAETPVPKSGNQVKQAAVYAQIDAGSVHPAAQSAGTTPQVHPVGYRAPADTTVVLAATTSGPADGANDGGGPAGSYGATSLKASDSWTGGGSNGSFTYSYPLQAPPGPSPLAPQLNLSYDSGNVDGQTSASQAQANWLGDGWSTPQSYIERSYKPCSDSPEGSAAPKSTPDECYDGEVLTLSLNGSTTSLVWDSGKKTYTPQDDNGEVVKHVTGSNNGSGTHDTDYWQVTDRTGTTYTFGRNQLPGWSSGKPATNSVDSEPVFSAHSGDPCYNATWASSWCTMAYRWNLDYVTDVHGNAMAYYYKQDTNAYAKNADISGTTTPKADATYVRDSHLDHIDYGFTDGNAYTVNSGHAPNQVLFTTGDRCLSGTCSPLSKSTAGNWPDVPYDLNCASGSSCMVTSPSFWSTVRLTGIKTQQWNGTAYAPVDSWSFTQTLPATGDGTSPTLWLSSITHTGSDTAGSGSAVTSPAVTFTAKAMDNRLDTVTDGLAGLTRMRISSVTTETGSVIGVNYTQADPCSASAKPDPATNTKSCYPVYWTPHDVPKQLLDWFIKYQVNSVTQSDPTGGGATMYTGYKYVGGAAWHYDDDELVKAKYRTYGQYRGYGDVQTFTGQGSDAQTEAETTYYRGMSKDNNSTAVTLTDSQGGRHEDLDRLAGQPLEETSYNFSGGSVTDSTIHSYWVSSPAASRSRSGLPALTATTTGEIESWTRQALASGSGTTWRKTETDTTYDDDTGSPTFGLPRYVYAHGDLNDSTQRRCTTTTYAPANTSKNLVGLPAEVENDAAACGGSDPDGGTAPTDAQTNALTAPSSISRPDDVVSDQRTFYDNPTLAQTWPQPSNPTWPQAAPTHGDISVVQNANGYSGGAFTYQTATASQFDATGRPTTTWDGRGSKTQTTYTINGSTGLVTGTTTTNPLGQQTSTTLDPLRSIPLTSKDANGIVTTIQYDGLGRTTGVWDANRSPSSPANEKYTYQISRTAPPAVTTQKMNDAQGYVTSTTLYDALMRPRQTQNVTPQGGRLITDTFYDSRGWTWKTNGNWWDPDNSPSTAIATVDDSQVPNQSVTDFDGAGRAVLTTSYDNSKVKSETATVYDQAASGGDSRTITVPLDGSGTSITGATAKATLEDALGRTTEVDEYTTTPTVSVNRGQGSAPTTTVTVSGGSTASSNGGTQGTSYLFDKTGHQSDVKSLATGDDWNTSYNLLGQIVQKKDPDAGTATIQYDAGGNVTETTDGRGKTISFTYDALGRKTAEYDAPTSGQAPDNQLASWVYDNSDGAVSNMPYPIGHLTHSTAYIGGSGSSGKAYSVQDRGFNVFGESLAETVTLPASEGALGSSYSFSHLYTTNTGLPLRDVYPATGSLPAETVTHSYSTALDLPSGLSSGLATYAVNVTWNAFTQMAQQEMGSTSTNAYVTNTYDEHTGAVTDTKLANTNVSATPIDETRYTYDPVGDPLSQTETRQGAQTETQCFGYDVLDRLAQAWTATDSCQSDPSTNNGATVGSGITQGAYWTSWQLNPLGQRTKQTQHGLDGTGDTVTTYTYDGNGDGQPHTLTKAATTGPSGSSSSTFSYDKAGNTNERTTPDHGDQSLTWNDAGQLTAATTGNGGASYIYGPDGSLLLQKDTTQTTLYLPGEQISLGNQDGSTPTGERFLALPGGGQAVRTGAGGNYNFESTDQHGTATLTLDPAFSTPTWRQQDPYGNPRGTTPTSWPDNLGFLGKPQDSDTGLTDIGARWYEPDTGTFLSLDPLLQDTDTQQQAGYNYAGSNPITYSDPSGSTRCDVGACPTPWQNVHGPNFCDTHDCSRHGGGKYNGHPWDDPDLNPYSGNPANGRRYLYNPGRYNNWENFLHRNKRIAEAGERALIAARRAAEQAANRREDILNKALQAQTHRSIWGTIVHIGAVAAPIVAGIGTFAGCEFLTDGVGSIGCVEAGEAADEGVEALEGLGLAADAGEEALGGAEEAGAGVEDEGEGLCNSFAGSTRVLMADGTSKSIDKVKVGDKIANNLPGVHKGEPDQAHTVTAIHVTKTDRNYTDVTVVTPDGQMTITGTAHHLYWDETTRAWTRADQLRVGGRLQTREGHTTAITALHSYTATMVTYNLTIDHLHTYYVEAGATPVLVHNTVDGLCPTGKHLKDDPECNCDDPGPAPWKTEPFDEASGQINNIFSQTKDMIGHGTQQVSHPETPVSQPVGGPLESWPIVIAAGARGIRLLVRRMLGR